MGLGDVFRILRLKSVGRRPPRPGEIILEDGDGAMPVKEGVFITPQSLASFPGAVAGIEVLARVTHAVATTTNYQTLTVIWAFLTGAVLFGIGIAETWASSTIRDRATAALVALINTAILLAAASGIDTLSGSSSNSASH